MREIQKQQTKLKILKSAMALFSTVSYEEASINKICEIASVSKGIIYHHFKDKDELYLACVAKCVEDLEYYLKQNCGLVGQLEDDIDHYFAMRETFFTSGSVSAGVYMKAITTIPHHLAEEFQLLNRQIVDFNRATLIEILDGVALQESLTLEEAVEFFNVVSDYTNLKSVLNHEKSLDFKSREKNLKSMMKILLYGIVRRAK